MRQGLMPWNERQTRKQRLPMAAAVRTRHRNGGNQTSYPISTTHNGTRHDVDCPGQSCARSVCGQCWSWNIESPGGAPVPSTICTGKTIIVSCGTREGSDHQLHRSSIEMWYTSGAVANCCIDGRGVGGQRRRMQDGCRESLIDAALINTKSEKFLRKICKCIFSRSLPENLW
jgi:hypothetical protein